MKTITQIAATNASCDGMNIVPVLYALDEGGEVWCMVGIDKNRKWQNVSTTSKAWGERPLRKDDGQI